MRDVLDSSISIKKRYLYGYLYRKHLIETIIDAKMSRLVRGRSAVAASSATNSDPRKRGKLSLYASSTSKRGRRWKDIRENKGWAIAHEILTLAAELACGLTTLGAKADLPIRSALRP